METKIEKEIKLKNVRLQYLYTITTTKEGYDYQVISSTILTKEQIIKRVEDLMKAQKGGEFNDL